LPEKAKVYVVVPDLEVPWVPYIGSPRLVHPEQAADFVKKIGPKGREISAQG
jgi:hypothetical protein